jgi:hypothetical protein
MRFTLLREREDRCARGDVEACDFFRPGYFELDELVHEVRSIVPSVRTILLSHIWLPFLCKFRVA